MELIPALRILWRRRLLVLVGVVAAGVLGLELSGGATPASGVADVGVVVDTSRSELVTGAPRGADTLWWRATLLAMLLSTDSQRAGIAQDAHIREDQLAVGDVELTAPAVPASLPTAATQAAGAAARPYALTVRTDDVMPVITIDAAAPDRDGAARLAGAAVRALRRGASPRDTAELQGLSIQPTGSVESRTIPGGSGHKQAAMLTVVLVLMWLAAVLAGPALRGVRRTLAETRALSG